MNNFLMFTLTFLSAAVGLTHRHSDKRMKRRQKDEKRKIVEHLILRNLCNL